MEHHMITAPVAGCMRWGKWGANYTTAEYRTLIEGCLEAGITSFDHADIYGDYTTEAEFGAALAEAPQLRAQMQLISKCGIRMVTPNRPAHLLKSYDTSAEHIVQSVEQSLKNLHTDYLDLLLIHRPDPLLHPGEVAKAIDSLLAAGKILAFGVSNFLPHQTDLLMRYTQIRYNQFECSITATDPFFNGILDHCMQHQIIPMAWAPMGGAKLFDEGNEVYLRILPIATQIAQAYNTGINEVLLAFLHKHPAGIIPVVGTSKLSRLQEAKRATQVHLHRADWFALLEAARGHVVA